MRDDLERVRAGGVFGVEKRDVLAVRATVLKWHNSKSDAVDRVEQLVGLQAQDGFGRVR